MSKDSGTKTWVKFLEPFLTFLSLSFFTCKVRLDNKVYCIGLLCRLNELLRENAYHSAWNRVNSHLMIRMILIPFVVLALPPAVFFSSTDRGNWTLSVKLRLSYFGDRVENILPASCCPQCQGSQAGRSLASIDLYQHPRGRDFPLRCLVLPAPKFY